MSDFPLLVDRTRFDLVCRLVNRAGSPVTDVLFVESPALLCQMAEVLTSPVTQARRQRLQRWFEEGRVAVGTYSDGSGSACARNHSVDLHAVGPDASCDVLYLPPYYLVHLQGGSAWWSRSV